MAHFRTVIIGFPACAGADGVAMLKRVQKRHKFYSLARNRMIGLMYAEFDAPGLWNPGFPAAARALAGARHPPHGRT